MGISNWYLIYWCAAEKEMSEEEIKWGRYGLSMCVVNSVNCECTEWYRRKISKKRFDQQRTKREKRHEWRRSQIVLWIWQIEKAEEEGERERDGIRHFIYIGTRLPFSPFLSVCVDGHKVGKDEWCNQWWPRNNSRIKHNSEGKMDVGVLSRVEN